MSDARIIIEVEGRTEGARRIKRELDSVNNSADKTTKTMGMLKKAVIAFGGVAIFAKATKSAIAFEKSMAEINTLLSDQSQFEKLKVNLIEINKEFGGDTQLQAKALYDIISAGASDAAQATAILTAANKLAIGGVTDVSIAADGLTSVMNAYADDALSAAEVSDSLFVAMRAGKTTIGELSSSLGKVAPLAQASGVRFDELTASIAALTKSGIQTTEAVTGVRAILAAVAKPSSEAQKKAKELGIEFNATGLAAKGFAGFIEDLVQKTGGSSEQLAQLFGGVEALVPILALSGSAGVAMNEILADMENKAGATDAAFGKMSQTADFLAGTLQAKLNAQMRDLGLALLPALTTALIFLNENFDAMISAVTILGGALAALAIKSVATALIGLTAQLYAAATAAGALSFAMIGATGVVAAIGAIVAAAYVFRTEIEAVFIKVIQEALDILDKLENKLNSFGSNFSAGASFLGEKAKNLVGITSDDEFRKVTQQIIGRRDASKAASEIRTQNRIADRGSVADDMIFDLLGDKGQDFVPSNPIDMIKESQQAAGEAFKETREQIKQSTKATKEFERGITEIDTTMDDFRRTTANTFADMVTGAMSAKDALRQVLRELISLTSRQLMGGAGGGLGGILSGVFGGGSSAFGSQGGISRLLQTGSSSFIGPLPAFANGGTMVVGGNAGVDRNLLSINGNPVARVGRGETLSIDPNKTGSGGIVINQTINVQTGVQQTVRAEMQRFMPMIQSQTVRAVEEARNRGVIA